VWGPVRGWRTLAASSSLHTQSSRGTGVVARSLPPGFRSALSSAAKSPCSTTSKATMKSKDWGRRPKADQSWRSPTISAGAHRSRPATLFQPRSTAHRLTQPSPHTLEEVLELLAPHVPAQPPRMRGRVQNLDRGGRFRGWRGERGRLDVDRDISGRASDHEAQPLLTVSDSGKP